MKQITTVFLLTTFLLLIGCQQKGKKVEVKTDEEKTVYAIGAMFGQRLSNLALTERELQILAQGLQDSAGGKKTQIEVAKYQREIQAFFKKKMSKNSEQIKKKGKDHLAKFLSEPGAKKTASGLAYKIIKEGQGASPKPTDVVEVHYHGTLIDGTVFDSSVERGKKVSFPLNRVIKGWTEGLQLTKVGGKIRLVIPSELAYGDNGAPPKIPGGATLIFDVELFSIKAAPKAAAPKVSLKPAAKKAAPKKKK
ncbi:MAG: FKBP-type peptidyl-prolyl cis-trans isomerase [Bacteriovoracaceae bacterium]|nr:FKBP-type peptidyl-prolyl cis-trans isomerase [Bacteriovoracaceae bacterium]